MATSCFLCAKRPNHGNNVSHAKNRTKRLRKVNLHRTTLTIADVKKKVSLCTSCLRMVKKAAVRSTVRTALPTNS